MLKRKKFVAAIVAVMTFFTSCITASVFGLSITEDEVIMKDVTYKHVQTLYGSGWQDIHIVTADLSKPHLAFKVLSDERGGSYLLNPYEMAKKADAVVAINADFFAAKTGQSGRGSAVGMEISDGKLKTTPSVAEDMNVFYQTTDGNFLIDSFEFDITVTAPNGKSDKIRHINKYDDLTQICIYTPAWGEYSPGSKGGIIEVVVEDGKVTQRHMEEDGVVIPENGYVIASHLSYNTFIYDYLQIDDEVKIDISATPDYEKIENAVSGGGVLVIDGVPQTQFSHNITGYHPRSAIGIDKAGKKITLVAVDGRRDGAKGMSQAELAKYMASLGCAYALNFDGGGSTLLVGKKEGNHTVLNAPASSYKRPVTNSVGIIATEALGKTESIKATAKENIFVGTKTKISVAGYDELLRKTEDIPSEKVSFEVETSNGHVKGDTFYATEPGLARVLVKYEDASCYIDINVLGPVHRLEFEKEDINLSVGEKYALNIRGYDKYGYSAPLDAEDVIFGLSSDCVEIKNGVLEQTKDGSAVISASFGDAVSYMSVSTPGAKKPLKPQNISAKDDKNVSAELTEGESFRFTVFGNLFTPKTLIDYIALNRSLSVINKQGELHAFIGNVEKDFLTGLSGKNFSAKGHSVFTHKGSTFITIQKDKENIYDSNSGQWESIEKAIKNVEDGNLFVFIDDTAISSLDVEKRIFEDLLEGAVKNGANVYVFGGGNKNEIKLADGVRYIETAGIYDNLGTKDETKDIRDIKYFLVTVNGNDVTYEEKNVLK